MSNGVYSVKLYTDSVPEDGLFRMTDSFDAMGPIARDVDDLIALADVMTGTQTINKNADIIPENPFDGWRIGATSPEWGVHESMFKGKWDQLDVVSAVPNPFEMQSNKFRLPYTMMLLTRLKQMEAKSLAL